METDHNPSTPDSKIRTTEQAPIGLSSAEPVATIEERQQDIDCPVHGKQTLRQIRYRKDWWPTDCQLCRKEAQEKREAAEKEAEEKRRVEGQRRALEQRVQRACIPPRFQHKTFSAFDNSDPKTQKKFETCREYAEFFPDMRKNGVSMILCGNAGTGKTHLACAIAHTVIHTHGMSALYITAGHAFRMVKDTYNRASERSEQDVYGDFMLPSLLILDEIGVQYGSESEKNILFEIINQRYEAMLPTIIISNLALTALTEYAGDRVIDRMIENGGRLVVFDWDSRRGA